MSKKVNSISPDSDDKPALVPKLRFPEFQGKKGWENKLVGPYLEDCSGRVPPDTELPVYSSTREGLKRQDAYFDGRVLQNKNEYGVVPPGCFVYRHMSDDGLFKFNINETGGDIAVSKEYPVFSTKGLNPVFLLAKLNDGLDFKQFALSQKAGGTRTRLYFSRLSEWRTLLPSPPEQQKIAECLSSVDELLAAQARKVDALKTHKKGLMQQLFPREGETQPARRFAEFQNAGEWEVDRFDKLLEVIDGDRGANYPKAEEYSQSGFCLFLSAANVSKTGFKFEAMQFVSKERDDALRKGKLKRADIVLTTRGTVGQFAFYSGEIPYENIRINSGMVILRTKGKKLVPEYLYSFTGSEVLSSHIKKTAFGNAQQQLTVGEINKFQLCYPSPEEQQRIAECLTRLDALITAETQKLEALNTHKKGLMQQLFPSQEVSEA
jgi:type I restriction enzyme S subunit